MALTRRTSGPGREVHASTAAGLKLSLGRRGEGESERGCASPAAPPWGPRADAARPATSPDRVQPPWPGSPAQAQQQRQHRGAQVAPPQLHTGAGRRHSAGARLHLNGAADRRRLPGAADAELVGPGAAPTPAELAFRTTIQPP